MRIVPFSEPGFQVFPKRVSCAPSSRLLGVDAFNAPDLHTPEKKKKEIPVLNDLHNFMCTHCDARLPWEERSLNCCKSGAVASPRLRPVSDLFCVSSTQKDSISAMRTRIPFAVRVCLLHPVWTSFHLIWKQCLGTRRLGKLKFACVVFKNSACRRTLACRDCASQSTASR